MHCNSIEVSTKQRRIATLAKQSPEMAFTSLAYLMNLDWLFEAYRQTRKTERLGSMGLLRRSTNKTLKATFKRCLSVRSLATIAPHLFGESTFQKGLPRRKFAQSAFPHWKIKFFSVRS